MSSFSRWLRPALLGAFAIAAFPARSWTLGQAAEAPPAIYADGPSRTGRTWEMRMKNVEQVDYVCRSILRGTPLGAKKGFYYTGCYSPGLDAVILVEPAAWPSRAEWEAIRAHEWAHARGWRHNADGRGTDWAASLPPPGHAVAQLSMAAAPDRQPIK